MSADEEVATDRAEEPAVLEALLDHIRRSRGLDFTGYKRTTLTRRIDKRMQMLGIDRYEAYMDRLEADPQEFAELFNFILIKVTDFFRDPDVWKYLGTEVVPRILESKGDDDPIRVWCAGCATGQEAYSVAMVFAEAVGTQSLARRVRIFATDIDEGALAVGRYGVYTEKAVENIPPDLLQRYFDPTGQGYIVDRDLRGSLVFGRHDLTRDAPISRVDLLVCRNTLMYFNLETQGRIVGHFFFAVNEGGFIMLGRAEMMLASGKAFSPIDMKHRIFVKRSGQELRDQLVMLAKTGGPEAAGQLADPVRGWDAALDAGPVAQIVIDLDGTLVLINEKARELFGFAQDDIGRSFRDLEASYQPIELRSLIKRAYEERRVVRVSEVPVEQGSSPAGYLDVDVQPLIDDGGAVLGTTVHFTDVTQHKELKVALESSNQELETAMEELQSTNEELQSSNEELEATNEELQSTNEELQSTNEELETMNEELQSTNEELATTNEELRERGSETEGLNAFLQTILTSVKAAVIVLDSSLHVQIWNERSQDLWGLREDEVKGKALTALDIGLPADQIIDGIRACLEADAGMNETTIEALNRKGHKIRCRIQCSPLRSLDKQVQGVVLIIDELADPQST